eukprot:3121840-Prymnesium_polylepis.1
MTTVTQDADARAPWPDGLSSPTLLCFLCQDSLLPAPLSASLHSLPHNYLSFHSLTAPPCLLPSTYELPRPPRQSVPVRASTSASVLRSP